MKNFYNLLRHIRLINRRIFVYAVKEIWCILKGGKRTPSLNEKNFSKYMDDIKNGKKLRALPMGAYEYGCCVEYLKLIQRILWSKRNNFNSLVLEFSQTDKYGIIMPPLEDCLEMVAKEVGFKLTNENIFYDKYSYTLESTFYGKN